ncbi:MAG: 2'-5' RNA ligase family protein [Thermoanaerobaculia bacterium]
MEENVGSTPRSLWLIPDPAASRVLAEIIQRASHRLATPRFRPHLTLLGNVPGDVEDSIAKSARLAARITPFAIDLVGVAHEPGYFRCVSFEARLSPALRRARRAARRFFRVTGQDLFRPHVSVVYGKVGAAERDRRARGLLDYVPMRFRAAALELVFTGGPPRAWRPIARFSLSGRGAGPAAGGARSRRS